MTDRPYRILFLCTHNSARSIMAEAMVNEHKRRAFHRVAEQIRGRVQLLLALPLASLDRIALAKGVGDIGNTGPA